MSSVFPVLRVHGRPRHGDVRRVPAAELGAEVGGAAGDDRHLLAADRGVLHLAVCSLRHGPPQHRVSFWDKSVRPDGRDGALTFRS